MANKLLTTTVIGSFPKPSYLPIEDWFNSARNDGGMDTERVTKEFTQYIEKKSDSDEHLFVRAAKDVINLQIDAGIDIPTDGEVRRENYIHYHCRYLEGFDFKNLEHRVLRDGAYETNLPAVRNKIKHNGSSYSVHDFKSSQSVSSAPVKFTLPGPLTIMDTTADCFYDDRPKLNRDLAETVNKEILSLVNAGCKYIQVDEPLFARQVDDASSFGMEGIERCFHGVPKDVTKIIHMCCGYPDHIDDEDYKKADPESYHLLAKEVDELKIDQVSIEDAHCQNNLELLEKFKKKSVIFGAIAIASSRLESEEEIIDRINSALLHIDRERLVIAPDCGLGLLTPDLAESKLRVMCSAVKRVD
jgi:5-methyltetrahydropteroyltriglutamate--homocysteine methyltransferase|tara:strand:- start:1185 stop:2261 length:1077 start_codon:yes stop_codon:yes gene_type:complete